jgi:hypothetical protein
VFFDQSEYELVTSFRESSVIKVPWLRGLKKGQNFSHVAWSEFMFYGKIIYEQAEENLIFYLNF